MEARFKRASSLCRQMQLNTEDLFCKVSSSQIPKVLIMSRQKKYDWNPLYRWTFDNKIVLLRNDQGISWLARSNLQSQTLRVIVVLDPPYVMLAPSFYNGIDKICRKGILCRSPLKTKGKTVWTRTCCVGLLMDILEKLKTDLWLHIDVHIVEDGHYGSLVNGSWDGAVGELVEGKGDMILAAITATKARAQAVEIGESFLEVVLSILMRKKMSTSTKFVNFGFMQMLSGHLLICVFCLAVFGIFLLFLVENRFWLTKHVTASKYFPFLEAFTYFSGITFQRDLGGKNPKHPSTRITVIPFAFGMVIIMSTYTAMLTADKVKQEDKDPFLGFHDRKVSRLFYANDFLPQI